MNRNKSRLTRKEFEQWIVEMNNEVSKCFGGSAHNMTCGGYRYYFSEYGYSVVFCGKYTTISHIDGRIGVAKCDPHENFKHEIGIAVAWARFKGYTVPSPASQIAPKLVASTFSNGDKFIRYYFNEERIYTFIGKLPEKEDIIVVQNNTDGKIVKLNVKSGEYYRY